MAWTAATRGDYVRPSGSHASDVTDREWTLIAPLPPAAQPGGRRRWTRLRRVIDTISYLLRTGCQGADAAAGLAAPQHRLRLLPGLDRGGRLGRTSTTCSIARPGSSRVAKRARPRPSSTVRRVKTGPEARDRSGTTPGKRVKGGKRHIVTDSLGPVRRIEVHSAGVQDRDGAALILDRIARRSLFLERFFADAGYPGPRVAEAAPRPVEIIRRSEAGFVAKPKRWVVERTFAWVGINRRLARDIERFAETAKALFQIATIKLMTRTIARYRGF